MCCFPDISSRLFTGTVVYEGVFHGRPVAVKRVLKEFADMAANEKDILILSDEHPNLVRLFAVEEDAEFIYLALEKCQKNLSACITPEGLASIVAWENIYFLCK